MAKKFKEQMPNPNSVPNRDIIQRLNFLYQAGTYLCQLAPEKQHPTVPLEVTGTDHNVGSGSGLPTNVRDEGVQSTRTYKPKKRKVNTGDLARSYVKTMRAIGQKTNVRMDPSVKRTLCKRCNTVLMPGITARIRVKPLQSHSRAVLTSCLHCSTSRRLPAPPILHEDSDRSMDGKTTDEKGVLNEEPIEGNRRVEESTLTFKQLIELYTDPTRYFKYKKVYIVRQPVPFFEREGHILFIGNEVVDASRASE